MLPKDAEMQVLTRRSFVKLLGATVAAAGTASLLSCESDGGNTQSAPSNPAESSVAISTTEPQAEVGQKLFLAPILDKRTGKWGYIDDDGAWVIEPRFDTARSFGDNGLAWADGDDGIGYVNGNGQLVIKLGPKPYNVKTGDFGWYTEHDFSNGFASVLSFDDNLWGVIDESGTWIIKPQFRKIGGFASNGLAAAEDPNSYQWGFIDHSGAWVIQPRFSLDLLHRGFADNGLAEVQDPNSHRWGFIDYKGAWIIEPKFYYATGFSNNGLAFVQVNAYTNEIMFEIINENGITVAETALRSECQLGFSNNGLAPAYGYEYIGSFGALAGYLNQDGVWAIEPRFKGTSLFADNNLAHVLDEQTSLWGFIDETGTWVIEPKYSGCYAFGEAVI